MNDNDDPVLTAALRVVGDSVVHNASFEDLAKLIDRDRRRRRWSAIVVATAAVAAVAISAVMLFPSTPDEVNVVAGGGPPSNPTPASSVDSAIAPPADSAIAIDVEARTYLGGRSNLVHGTLRADHDLGCLYLETDAGRLHLVFPAGSTVAYDPLRVLEADGTEFARVDQPAAFGGSIADPAPIPTGANGCGSTQSIHVWRF